MLQKLSKKSDILKKITKKKNSNFFFSSKKIKKSKLANFRFQLDRKLGFWVRAKNCKIEKAGRTWLQGGGGSSTWHLVVSAIHRWSYLKSELLQLKVHLSQNRYNLREKIVLRNISFNHAVRFSTAKVYTSQIYNNAK